MIPNKYHQINYEMYFYNKLIWSHNYKYYSLKNLVKRDLLYLARNP